MPPCFECKHLRVLGGAASGCELRDGYPEAYPTGEGCDAFEPAREGG